jgi:predicted phage tail protein
VHFGLGTATLVDLRVTYLDGTAVTIPNLNSRRTLILKGSTVLDAPQAPQGLTAGVLGTLVTFNWSPPSGGGAVSQYVLEAGSAPGLANLATVALGNRTSFSVNAPAGVYYVRLRATNYAGTSVASNEVVVRLGGACSAPPTAPSSFSAQISGLGVTFNWVGTSSQEPTTAYVLEVGSVSGAANLATVQTANTSFSAVGPPGLYYTRVRARNACGVSPPSNEVVVQLGCQGPPGTPTGLSAMVNGSAVTLDWSAGPGQTPDRYILEVGLTPAATNFVFDTGSTATALSTSAPAGTYYARIRARNSCGTSGVSNEVMVVVQ